MDRGAYAKLSQDDDPVESEARNQGASPRDEGLRIDYVLVYETCQEEEDEQEHKKKEAEKLENLRRSYEKRLEKKGLIIRQDSITVKKVFLVWNVNCLAAVVRPLMNVHFADLIQCFSLFIYYFISRSLACHCHFRHLRKFSVTELG